MPVEINDSDILMAEKILFGKAGIFSICEGDSDEVTTSKNQRIEFIKNLKMLDLRAVPGSGKTTALLVKLIILESKLPFDDGSGILVLSHTNAAVDEIKRKIEHHCPKLFHYPNFVGTIQSFVDQFLATPYYSNKNYKRPYRIDNEIYEYELIKLLERCIKDQPFDAFKKVKAIWKANSKLLLNYRFNTNEEGKVFLVKEINGSLLDVTKPHGRTKKENYLPYTQEEKESVENYLVQIKNNLIRTGFLHYDDAYFLSKRYLSSYPIVKAFLQKRFQFAFVDEMQDMDEHQVELLEKLFYDDGKSESIYQRIGDKNQAIHNDIESEDCWKDRIPKLEFTGSHRLNPFTAKVVQPFGLYSMELLGLAKSEIDFVKPHLIIYDDPKDVLPKFEKLIKEKTLDQVKTNDKYPFRAIGWVGPYRTKKNGKKKEEIDYDKHVIKCFFEAFKKESEVSRTDYTYLSDYLHCDAKDNTLASIQKNILNAIVKALREADIIDELSQRPFSVASFLKYYKEKEGNEDAYRDLKLKLYEWSFSIVKQTNKYDDIEAYIRVLIDTHFKKSINERVNSFLSNRSEKEIKNQLKVEAEFIYTGDNGLNVKLGTIHSVKGETHVATLVFDTFYEKFNSLMLPEPFKGEPHGVNVNKPGKDKLKKRTAKMLYVAFSRPTHILCFAIHKDRYDEVFQNIAPEDWCI